jgi:hypothetical protein
LLIGGLEHLDYFFDSVGNVIITTDELIFLRGVGSTTNQFGIQWGFGYQIDMN